jgi:hypothetical protein
MKSMKLRIVCTNPQFQKLKAAPLVRFNSTISYEDPEITKKRDDIKQRLTGKPFDGFEEYTIPFNKVFSNVEKYNPDTFPSPFVHLDENVALNIILNENSNKKNLSKYDYFLRIRWDHLNKFHDKLSIALNWQKRHLKSYQCISNLSPNSNLKLTDEIKSEIFTTISDEKNYDFQNAIDYLSEKFPKLSNPTLINLYIKTVPEFSQSQQDLFLESMTNAITENILNYHDQALQSICLNLLDSKKIKPITSIIRAYNEFTHSDFLSMVSESFSQKYLEGLIEIKEVSTAKAILEKIENKRCMPTPNVITAYVKLVNNISSNVDTTQDKKEMLFNLLTKPVSGMVLQKDVLNEEIIKNILQFIRLNIIHLFVKYLKQSPDYKNIKTIPDLIINRISTSSTFGKKSDQEKAIFLTSLLKLLDFESSELSESVKKSIIKLYANSHSPLAVLSWSKKLENPLTEEEKEIILKALDGESDNVSNGIDISDKL